MERMKRHLLWFQGQNWTTSLKCRFLSFITIRSQKTLTIRRELAYLGALNFHAMKLEVAYWPDKSDESGVARLTVIEDKIPKWEKESAL